MGVLLFLVEIGQLVTRRLDAIGRMFIESGQCLIDLAQCFQRNGPMLPTEQIEYCFDAYSKYLFLTRDVEDLVFPKRHVVAHAIERLSDQGNPRFFGNWWDEALNKVLKSACRTVSQVTFESSLVKRMRPLLANVVKKRGYHHIST